MTAVLRKRSTRQQIFGAYLFRPVYKTIRIWRDRIRASVCSVTGSNPQSVITRALDVFECAVFSEWDYNLHTCEPFEVPETWEM